MGYHDSTPESVLSAPKQEKTIAHPVTLETDPETGEYLKQPPRRFRRMQVILARRRARKSMEDFLFDNPSPDHKVNLRSDHWLRRVQRQQAIELGSKGVADER